MFQPDRISFILNFAEELSQTNDQSLFPIPNVPVATSAKLVKFSVVISAKYPALAWFPHPYATVPC